ncbi:hypothetical protein AB6A40_008869 [Gnathostoma spinigerum]|uniref:Uncharacterized protein n=1 Tax=Gnathostoma spinigerum TaxID=75299 RepID=A0ABD6EQB6_9BILA
MTAQQRRDKVFTVVASDLYGFVFDDCLQRSLSQDTVLIAVLQDVGTKLKVARGLSKTPAATMVSFCTMSNCIHSSIGSILIVIQFFGQSMCQFPGPSPLNVMAPYTTGFNHELFLPDPPSFMDFLHYPYFQPNIFMPVFPPIWSNDYREFHAAPGYPYTYAPYSYYYGANASCTTSSNLNANPLQADSDRQQSSQQYVYTAPPKTNVYSDSLNSYNIYSSTTPYPIYRSPPSLSNYDSSISNSQTPQISPSNPAVSSVVNDKLEEAAHSSNPEFLPSQETLIHDRSNGFSNFESAKDIGRTAHSIDGDLRNANVEKSSYAPRDDGLKEADEYVQDRWTIEPESPSIREVSSNDATDETYASIDAADKNEEEVQPSKLAKEKNDDYKRRLRALS